MNKAPPKKNPLSIMCILRFRLLKVPQSETRGIFDQARKRAAYTNGASQGDTGVSVVGYYLKIQMLTLRKTLNSLSTNTSPLCVYWIGLGCNSCERRCTVQKGRR